MTSGTIAFREAVPADIDELALITERAKAQRDSSPVPTMASDETVESVRVRMDRVRARTLVATMGEKIVGYTVSHPLIETESDTPQEDTGTEHLAMLMVDPDYWGKKVASRLLELTIERAQNEGKVLNSVDA